MIPFAGYGFNKSHAAAYSVVAYRTAYLKAHFPAEFIAANLTNEITSTDKLPEYIAEGRAMGIAIDPPDVNRSDKVFDVVDNRIVYGLLGIKGLGEAAAEEIITQRNKNGLYKNFMDFLERVDLHTVNKKAIEVMIKTGCFDNVDTISRSVLFLNLEKAVDYSEQKKEDTRYGQVSLFEDTDEKEYSDFVFEQMPDWTMQEKLAIEKELIGFYISGHPLDEYRSLIEKTSSINIAEPSRARKDKPYTIVGMIKNIKTITTKTGKLMAFCQFEDINGTIDLTFFQKQWEKYRDKLQIEKVYGFIGKVDLSRGMPSFLVDEVIQLEDLQERSVREIHIKLRNGIKSEKDLQPIKNFLFEKTGTCSVYFHIEISFKKYVVMANQHLKVPYDDEFISGIKNLAFVENVWKE